MTDKEFLKDLKPGDQIFVEHSFSVTRTLNRGVVTKITKTQIVVDVDGYNDLMRFNKMDGSKRGSSPYNYYFLKPNTEKNQEESTKQSLRSKIKTMTLRIDDAVGAATFKDLNIDQLTVVGTLLSNALSRLTVVKAN